MQGVAWSAELAPRTAIGYARIPLHATLLPRHYVPLRADLSDFENITKLITEAPDAEVTRRLERIAVNAQALVKSFSVAHTLKRVSEQLNRVW